MAGMGLLDLLDLSQIDPMGPPKPKGRGLTILDPEIGAAIPDPFSEPVQPYGTPQTPPPAWTPRGASPTTAPSIMPGAGPMSGMLADELAQPQAPAAFGDGAAPMAYPGILNSPSLVPPEPPARPAPALAPAPAAVAKEVPSGSLLDRLGKGLGRLSDLINQHPLTLMALGAGMANSQNIGMGLQRGLSAAVPAMQADQKLQIQQQGIAQTYKAMVERGVPPQDALAAVYNPDVMKAVVTKYFEAKTPTWGVVGHDRFNNPIYGFVDPYKEQVVPPNTRKVTSFEEALRLPKGTQFLDPDGVLRVR